MRLSELAHSGVEDAAAVVKKEQEKKTNTVAQVGEDGVELNRAV